MTKASALIIYQVVYEITHSPSNPSISSEVYPSKNVNHEQENRGKKNTWVRMCFVLSARVLWCGFSQHQRESWATQETLMIAKRRLSLRQEERGREVTIYNSSGAVLSCLFTLRRPLIKIIILKLSIKSQGLSVHDPDLGKRYDPSLTTLSL